jgi:hypothetical protein
MLLSVGVADIGTYRHLRDLSRDRLKNLALDIESSLREELTAMHAQLEAYDLELQQQAAGC